MRNVVCRWFVALLGVFIFLDRVESQDTAALEIVFPRNFSERELFRELALLNPESPIHRIVKADPVGVAQTFRFRTEVLQAEIQSIRNAVGRFRKQLQESDAEMSQLQQIIAELQKKAENDSGMSLVNQDSVNMLMQNCLVELQRLQWEIASEKSISEQKATKPDSRVIEAQLEAQRVQVNSSRVQLDELVKQFELAQKRVNTGQAGSAELSKITREVEAGRAMFAIAEAGLVAEQAKLEALIAPRASESVGKLVQLKARQKAVMEQMEQLGKQRQVHYEISKLQSSIERLQGRIEPIYNRLVEQELLLDERELMVESMTHALQKFDSSVGQEKKPGPEKKIGPAK